MIVATWIVTLVLARTVLRSWWQPAAVLTLVLSINAVGAYIFANDYYQSIYANLYLQVAAIAAILGNFFGGLRGGRAPREVALVIGRDRRAQLLAAGYLSSFGVLFGTASSLGVPISKAMNVTALADIAQS